MQDAGKNPRPEYGFNETGEGIPLRSASHGAFHTATNADIADDHVLYGLPNALEVAVSGTILDQVNGPRAIANASAIATVALHALAGSHGVTTLDNGDPAMTIARQVADMAQGLAALADRLVGQPSPSPAETNDVAEADCVAFLESQFRIRRLRGRHLHGLALGEPAWDILLDLAVAQHWHRETSVTSLCIAADVPSTTALRWINSMTRAGLIVRRACQRDGRRSFLAISPVTFQAMLAFAADALRAEQRVRHRYNRSAA